jgi:hypothetical protein
MISKSQSGLFNTDLDFFQNMLVCDSLRGEDSTGVFGIYKNRQARTLKVAAEPHMLFRCPEWQDFRTKAVSSMNIIVGHNRSATRGAVNSDNAHPFNEGKIVLVHNGTLHNQKDFNKEVEVDSHAITHALNERPAKDVLKDIDGAFAFVWYDREEGKLFIARNSERPLSFIETNGNIIFASEGSMLEYLVNRKTTYNTPKATMFPVGQLISFDLKGNKTEEAFELYRPKYTGVTYPKPVVTPTTTTIQTTGTASDLITKGVKVLVKFDQLTGPSKENGNIKVRGKLVDPQTGVDFVGWLATGSTMEDGYKMLNAPFVQGYISGSHTTNCGRSYFVNGIEPAEMVQAYNTKIPSVTWNHIVDNCTCDKCQAPILRHQLGFTSVKRRGNTDRYRVVCSECLYEALDEATVPNIKDSNSQVQEGQQISKGPSNWPYPNIKQECIIH